jgi:hypothetical protein
MLHPCAVPKTLTKNLWSIMIFIIMLIIFILSFIILAPRPA